MLKRFHVYLLWIWLFALMQTGFVTHEISHLKELTQQSQPDKKTGSEPCTLCVSTAHTLGTLPTALTWALPLATAEGFHPFAVISGRSKVVAVYAARAPPVVFSR